ncbi:MAG TPA: hypothetical protein PKC65_06950 [Pyrinomonadaceae bacterium]|nr:hypothetical protein [Pyrinomonadaceae bacterium]HMM79741.1 hypothetical protein [Pyrinomonadaceae bacterium]
MFVELGHHELSNCHGIYAVDQGRRSFLGGGLPPTMASHSHVVYGVV